MTWGHPDPLTMLCMIASQQASNLHMLTLAVMARAEQQRADLVRANAPQPQERTH